MSDDVMLQEAIDAIKQGQRRRARDLLTRLLRADQQSPVYWLWMSSVVDTVKEQIYCLQQVQRFDPENAAAKRGLALVGALSSERTVSPMPPIRRNWQVDVEEEPPQGIRALWANPALRLVVFVGIGIVVFGLILGGIFGFGRRAASPVAARPTRTPGAPPTFTLTPTLIKTDSNIATPTPTFIGQMPLWMLLEATYTPTPEYVNTPHPISEAYRLAQRASARHDLEAALGFYKDASQNEPDAPDIHYHIGEVERLRGNYEAALVAYDQAILIDPDFAPAYLGKTRSRLAVEPELDVGEDLNQAVEKDPNLVEAYLELVRYYLSIDDIAAAEEMLAIGEQNLPDSPLLHLYRAQYALQVGEYEAALEDAQEAHQRDITLIPAYKVLGQAAVINEDYETAVDVLSTYVKYEDDDPIGWLLLGQAHLNISGPEHLYAKFLETEDTDRDFEAALEAFDQALELDEENSDIYFYRGLAYLALDEGQQAVNEFFLARKVAENSFEVSLLLGRALVVADRMEDGMGQIEATLRLVETDEQQAAWLVIHAQAAETLGRRADALSDWKALLELPEGAVLESWIDMAQSRIAILASPTPTLTPTTTPTPTKTPTASKTPIFTATKIPTRTPRPTRTPSS